MFSVSFFLKNIGYEKTTKPYENTAIAIESLTAKETTPKYFYSIKDPKNLNQKPKVSAEAYLVGDLDTGEIILTKNQDQQFPIASVSKLMTAFIATELMNPDDIAKVSKKALGTYGENGSLKLGEKIKIAKLDVDQNQTKASEYQIQSIPSLKLFKNGQVVKDLIGLQMKAPLLETLKKYL